jgi:DNA-binding FadR family transcriptional regulator
MCLNALQDTYPEPSELVEEHRRLVDAIGDGEEERLLQLIEEHMTDSIRRLRTS